MARFNHALRRSGEHTTGMAKLCWIGLGVLAVWLVGLGLLLLGLDRAHDCPFSECGDSYIGWMAMVSVWGVAGVVAIPAGIGGAIGIVIGRARRSGGHERSG